MTINPKTCFILFIFISLIFADITVSGENKIEQQKKSPNKITLKKMPKKNYLPWIDERYSMMIIGPDCHSDRVDPGIIAKNTLDPKVHAELRVIDPYTKKEITWNRMPCFYFNKPGTKTKDKKYETPITVPLE